LILSECLTAKRCSFDLRQSEMLISGGSRGPLIPEVRYTRNHAHLK